MKTMRIIAASCALLALAGCGDDAWGYHEYGLCSDLDWCGKKSDCTDQGCGHEADLPKGWGEPPKGWPTGE